MSTSPRLFLNPRVSVNPQLFLSFGPWFWSELAKIIVIGSYGVCECLLLYAIFDKKFDLGRVCYLVMVIFASLTRRVHECVLHMGSNNLFSHMVIF